MLQGVLNVCPLLAQIYVGLISQVYETCLTSLWTLVVLYAVRITLCHLLYNGLSNI